MPIRMLRQQTDPREAENRPEAESTSKACMMVGYVHDSTTLWRIWDPEHNTVKAQSDVIFDEERNAYISCPQSLLCKKGVHDNDLEETTEIDIFGLLEEETHIEEIDINASRTDESIAHGCTQDTSGMAESISHGHTDEVARQTVTGNPAVAGAISDLPSTGDSTNAHGNRSPPASDVENGHTYIAPDEDAHTHTENGYSGHYPTLEFHHKVQSRDEVIIQRQLR